MSFRDKLSRLETAGISAFSVLVPAPARADLLNDLRARIEATLERTARRAPRPPPPVDTVDLPFATTVTPDGPLHVRVQRLSPAHRTGHAPLACARDASAELLALLALDPTLASCDPRGALYLDTETTGLAGGTGTVAFLVGLAWWDSGTLVLEQILVRALGEEGPMLARVSERLAGASMLVTFNGKTFDMPLLRTRFAMARLDAPRSPPHLDLLHVARRVHGKRLGAGCRLVTIERDVLGFERNDDVAGADVSACYLHFLRTGDTRSLLGVIEHNAWDVVAMVALLGLYGEGLDGQLGVEDLVGVARTLRRAGALERATAVAQAAVERDATPQTLRARADIAKARGDRASALADFESLAGSVDDASVRLELAKLYEHWLRSPERALEWVARGTGESEEGSRRRVDRLTRKAAARTRKATGLVPEGEDVSPCGSTRPAKKLA
ncbi:MAG TPA: ribonuclease H-like domain-containing protein [Polyangiaceae bacterium]